MWVVLLLAVVFLAASSAQAQVSESAIRGEHLVAFGDTLSAYHIDYGKRSLLGVSSFVDLNVSVHLGFEAKALWLLEHQEAGTHAAAFLVGPRYSFPAVGRLRPWATLLVGEGTFAFPYGYAQGHYFVVAPGGGLDYRINHRLRMRLCQVEYQQWPGFSFGPMSAYGVSTGLRYAWY